MGSLLVVSGPPGAGKSTVAGLLADDAAAGVLVVGDWFFGFLAAGAIEPWLPESNHQNTIVTEAAAAATGRFACDYETVYDGVVGPWFLQTFAAAAGLNRFDYVILLPSVEVCVDRVLNRTGHGFSDEGATRKMHAEFERAAIDPRHVLRTESKSPDETAAAVRQARSVGRLRYVV